jgi:cytochrome b561
LAELRSDADDISVRAGIIAAMGGSNRHSVAGRSWRRDFPCIDRESPMADATCAGRKVDHAGSPMTVQAPAIDLPAPRSAAGDSTPGAAAPAAYTITARVLHWLTAILILGMIPLGLVIANDWGGSLQDSLYDLHRSIGALVIPVILLRLVYRRVNPPLPLPDDIPAIQQLAAHAMHWCLYALLLVQPIIGWIATSAYRAPINVFGWFELPPIWPENRAFSEQMFGIHGLIGALIAALAAVHIGSALFHHFVRKDGVLMRMITG